MVRVQSRQQKRNQPTTTVPLAPDHQLKPATPDHKFTYLTPRKVSTSLSRRGNSSPRKDYKLCSSKTVFVFTPRQSPPPGKVVACKRKAPTPTQFTARSEPV